MLDELDSLGRGITPWERSFIENATDRWDRERMISDSQLEILEKIYEKRV